MAVSDSSDTTDPLVGRTLGDFVVEDRIGEGSFGAVYRAKQPHLGRLAAIKVLHTRLAAAGEPTDRFLREARTASSLDHPYAAHIYSSGAEPDGTLWIAMEYVRGTPFSAYLHAHAPMPLERFIPFLERVCEVVHSAHEQGIVHRDIKPANIMVLSRAGQLLPKLLDFGIAKAIAATAREGENDGDDGDDGDDEDLPDLAETIASSRAELEPSDSSSRRRRVGTPSLSYEDIYGRTRGSAENLTRRGEIIGSPYYMAPEQWDDAGSVDARSDLYALGVVSYEALTGKRPFSGKSMREIAEAHRARPVPPVPEFLPRSLDEVFAVALAKTREERYDDALALGDAFRRAASPSDDRKPPPRLPDDVRDRYLADAPQPLAEAIATLDAAREPRQARDALWAVADTLVHYLGVLALCARSRFGTLSEAAIPDALRRAGSASLSIEEWLAIAAALASANAERPELHPLPELVRFFGRDESAAGEAALRALWRHREPLARATAGEDALRERLSEALEALSTVLRRAEFVCDYPLAVPVERGGAASWTGLRRANRLALEVRGPPLRAGEPVLLGAEGAPILALSPLVQALRPSTGASTELFFFAGGSERGGKLVAMPHGFEQRDPEVLDWLRLQLETTFDSTQDATAGERAPYRGLEAYTADDASLYVGREREVDAFANRVQVEPFLAVVGPSGAGKSSFVQAGVIPALVERDPKTRVLVIRPGAAPLSALTSRLAAEGYDAEGLETRLRDEPEHLGELLREEAAGRGRLVVVVDQLEELFTLAKTDDERQCFVSALLSAAHLAGDSVRVIATLRDDFLLQAEALPALRERLAHSLKLLTTPGPEELERILVEPARRAGYEFEDPSLPGRMVKEVQGEPGALALLSFTAAKMWEARDRHFRRLPTRAYEDLGGVGGALAQHAEALLESLPQAERRLVRDAFRLLVTSEGTRSVLSRRELLSALGGGSAAEAAIEHLVQGRLLVIYDGEGGEQIEITHEALLTSWPRLVSWRREDAEGARLRDELRAAAVQWDRRGRPRGLLWRDDALAEYRIWRARYEGALTEVEEVFGRESTAVARRGRRQWQAVIAASFAMLAAGLAVLFVMHQRAEDARAEVSRQLLDSYLEQGSQALRSDDYYEAILFLSKAFEMGAEGPEIELMLSMAAAAFEPQVAAARHEGSIWETAFSPDGEQVVIITGAGLVYLRDGHDLAPLHEIEGHGDEVYRVSWDPMGERFATGSFDGTARIWDAHTGEELAVLDHDGEGISSLAFDSSGEVLVTGTWDGRVRMFRDLQKVHAVDAHTGAVWVIAAHPDGRHVVSAGEDGHGRVWDLANGELRAETPSQDGPVHHLALDPSGERIVTTSMGGTARIHRADTGERLVELTGHRNLVTTASFHRDGDLVATASHDGTARLWDAESGRELFLLEGHRGYVLQATFHGNEVLTSGADGTARRWDARTGTALAIMPASAGALGKARYSPDGERVVIPARDGRATLWSTDADSHRVIENNDYRMVSARFGRGSSRLVSAGRAEVARVWDGESLELVAEHPHSGPLKDADVAPDGRTMVTVSESGRVQLWDVGAPEPRTELGIADRFTNLARFSPDGSRVFVDGSRAALWNAGDGSRQIELDGGDATLIGPGFSRDGERLLAGGNDGRARLMDSETGEVLQVFEGHEDWIMAVDASPVEDIAVTASRDGTARLWDLEKGEARAVLAAHDGMVWDAAFRPDGNVVATAGSDGLVAVWGVRSGRKLARLSGHKRDVRSVSFAPGGTSLVSSSDDGSVRSWRIPLQEWSSEKVRHLSRCLPLELRDGNPAPTAALPEDC